MIQLEHFHACVVWASGHDVYLEIAPCTVKQMVGHDGPTYMRIM